MMRENANRIFCEKMSSFCEKKGWGAFLVMSGGKLFCGVLLTESWRLWYNVEKESSFGFFGRLVRGLEFTAEEFDIMVQELLYQEPLSYAMLCQIAEKCLKKRVYAMCAANEDLRGRKREEDVLQEVYIRLMNTTIYGFLLRQGVDGPVNRDPEGFRAWMGTVAKNIVRDEAKKLRRQDYHNTSLEDLTGTIAQPGSVQERQENIGILKTAMDIVITSKCAAYKMLTWMGFALFVHHYNIPGHQANRMVVEVFRDLPLSEMYALLRRVGSKAEWMTLTASQEKTIQTALNKRRDAQRIYAEVPYGEFFMKKGGSESVSDWVNRMNTIIRRGLEDAAPVSQ